MDKHEKDWLDGFASALAAASTEGLAPQSVVAVMTTYDVTVAELRHAQVESKTVMEIRRHFTGRAGR